MGILTEIFSPQIEAHSADPLNDIDFYGMPIGDAIDSGILVSSDTAMRIGTVYACVKVLSEAIASLPLIVYRRKKSGGKEKATDHWLYELLHNSPNQSQTSFDWREMGEGHLCLRGNNYSFIDWSGGRAKQLIPLHPDFVEPKRMSDGSIQYENSDTSVISSGRYLASEILHVPGLSFDGLKGISPIRYAAQCLGLTAAAEKFGAKLFKNGVRASGVVEYPPGVGATKESVANIKKSIIKQIGGENLHYPLILDMGAKWQQLSVNPDEAQFLETRKFQKSEIANIYGVPLYLLNDTEKTAAYASTEQFALRFVIHTIRPKCVKHEQRMTRQLIYDSDYFVEYNLDGLLRGDNKSRTEALSKQFLNGAITLDEWREIENRDPLPDGLGRKHYVPLNVAPVDAPRKPAKTQNPKQNDGGDAVIEDAAARIANAEHKAIESRIDKADSDMARFKAWLCSENHIVYTRKVVAPIGRLHGKGEDEIEAVISKIMQTLLLNFEGRNARDGFTALEFNRLTEIKDILEELTQ